MIKTFDELEAEREMLLSALDECDPNDEAAIQDIQDRLDIIEAEFDLNPDEY